MKGKFEIEVKDGTVILSALDKAAWDLATENDIFKNWFVGCLDTIANKDCFVLESTLTKENSDIKNY